MLVVVVDQVVSFDGRKTLREAFRRKNIPEESTMKQYSVAIKQWLVVCDKF